MGHLILDPNGLACTCGGRGCLEQYVSGPALLRHYRALAGATPIPDGVPLRAMALADPEGPAARAIAGTGELLGIGLTSLVNIFGPEQVIVGGGLAALGDLLLGPARAVVAARALPSVRDVPIVTAGLGADAAIVGAASLALAELGE
jgi:glucokinase